MPPCAAGIRHVRDPPEQHERPSPAHRPRVARQLAPPRPGNTPLRQPRPPANAGRPMRKRRSVARCPARPESQSAVGHRRRQFDRVLRAHEAGDERRRRARCRPPPARPAARSRPAFRMTMRSAMTIASSRSCVTWIAVMPSRRCSERISWRTLWRMRASRFDSGSSSSRMRGSTASARPSATRWRWPPDRCRHVPLAEAVEPQHRENARRPLRRSLRAGRAASLQPVADVLAHRHMRPQCVGLEHQRHVAAVRRQAVMSRPPARIVPDRRLHETRQWRATMSSCRSPRNRAGRRTHPHRPRAILLSGPQRRHSRRSRGRPSGILLSSLENRAAYLFRTHCDGPHRCTLKLLMQRATPWSAAVPGIDRWCSHASGTPARMDGEKLVMANRVHWQHSVDL